MAEEGEKVKRMRKGIGGLEGGRRVRRGRGRRKVGKRYERV